ncbi:hypothetical protein [Brassicibacter mesophilus]|uniref:hypothetical protein n=1 Tax=Brassicibacter mesophilus TaxID=745119 RepID=UPI003D2021E1
MEDVTFSRLYGIQKDNKITNYYIEGVLHLTSTNIADKFQLNETKEMEVESIYSK